MVQRTPTTASPIRTPLAMNTDRIGAATSRATLECHRTIFEEHLEEAGFLYEQRRAALARPRQSWRSVAGLEERIEAHVDALVLGDEFALEVCAERAEAGGGGELFAALCVFCRRRSAPQTARVFGRLDFSDAVRVQAAQDALCRELPGEWVTFVEQALRKGSGPMASLFARVAAYRNVPVGAALLDILTSVASPSMAVVDALGKLKAQAARSALELRVEDADPGIRSAALLALCQMGLEEPLRYAYRVATVQPWPLYAIGVGGDRDGCRALLRVAESGKADVDCIRALGVLGDPAALPLLVDALPDPERAGAAARALHWITGAPLFDDVFVPEAVDEDELVGAEVEAWRARAEAPRRPDGSSFGERYAEPSRDPARWRRWLSEHAPSMPAGIRLRGGTPCSPDSTIDALLSADTDPWLREAMANELRIRYGYGVGFDTDMPVAEQDRVLAAMRQEIASSSFQPGGWYFAGRAQ